MVKKAVKRIIFTTDPESGLLKGIAEPHSYRQFIIPKTLADVTLAELKDEKMSRMNVYGYAVSH